MEGRKNSGFNTSLFSDEEFKKMTEHSQFTEEELRRLTENAYVPPQRKVVRIDQKHDVIYYAAEEDNLNEPENSISQKNSDSPTKQSSSSTNQICNVLRNSNVPSDSDEESKKLAEFNKYNDYFLAHKTSIPAITCEDLKKIEKDRIVLVENGNCKDNLKKLTSNNNEESKESSSYKHLGLGLMVGICSYLALSDSRISIAFSAITAISSWLIFSKKVLPDGRFFTQHILKDEVSNRRSEEYERYSSINPNKVNF
jgi:hypothetical protein